MYAPSTAKEFLAKILLTFSFSSLSRYLFTQPLCSLLPTVFLIIVMIQRRKADIFMIAALMVSLTRVFLILNSLNMVLHQALHFISMTAKLKVLFDVGISIFINKR